MNAIEIRNLTKTFGEKVAVNDLNMTVPKGAIYGFIGENGSGKSTTEKLICGLINANGGQIKLFDKPHDDLSARAKIGVLIEAPGCFANCTVWNNLMIQATNLEIENPEDEVRRVLKTVRMEGSASNKYKNCSLGMKQRVGIAMALMGNPKLLVLDEPINGLDADGVRIMREVLLDLTKNHDCTVLISSHILGELEKIATHYGIIRQGKMIKQMTADQLDSECRTFVSINTTDNGMAKTVLQNRYPLIQTTENAIRVYDAKAEDVVSYLYEFKILTTEVSTEKIGLEEYYIDLMKENK